MKNCIFITKILLPLSIIYDAWWCFLIGLLLGLFFFWTLFAGGMNARVEKPCLMRCFFLLYDFDSKRVVSQNWLMPQNSLKQLLWMQLLLYSTKAKPVLQKSFHHVLLVFFLLSHLPSHFSNSSSNCRANSLIFALSDFLWHLWQVYSFLSLHMCSSSKRSLHCLLFLLHLHSLVLVVW